MTEQLDRANAHGASKTYELDDVEQTLASLDLSVDCRMESEPPSDLTLR